jgi:hypothetical protein
MYLGCSASDCRRNLENLVVDRGSNPGANPTIASYNASVVNFYNATGSLMRFENKNILFYFEKRYM